MFSNRIISASRMGSALLALCLVAFFVTACETPEPTGCGPESTSSACTDDEAKATVDVDLIAPIANALAAKRAAQALAANGLVAYSNIKRTEDARSPGAAARKPGSSPNGNGPASYAYDLSDLGDLNADGKFGVADVQCAILTSLATLSGNEQPQCLADYSLADLNCDGTVNVSDVQLVILKALGCEGIGCTSPFSPVVDSNQNAIHDTCEMQADPCAFNTCQNGGTCVVDADSYSCECTDGYSGETCEICEGDFVLGFSIGETGATNVSLDYLSGCTHITGSLQINAVEMTSLAGLENLTTVSDDLVIYGGPNLTTLKGLDGLKDVGGMLAIWTAPQLTDLSGLGNLEYVGANTWIDPDVEPGLVIQNNYVLTSLAGLKKLATVHGGVYIGHNYSLTDLGSLDQVEVIGGNLNIAFNIQLPTCEANAVAETLEQGNVVAGVVTIFNNLNPCADNPCGAGTCELDCSQPDDYICI
jgi:hypothetical protein